MKKNFKKIAQAAKYRIEFFKRSEEFQKLKEGELAKSYENLQESSRKIGDRPGEIKLPLLPLEEFLISTSKAVEAIPAVEIVFSKGQKIIESKFLDYSELFNLLHSTKIFGKRWRQENDLTLDAVKKDETILIKVHLDRQINNIIGDIKYLFDLIRWERKVEGKDSKSAKRPHWDVYDKYIEVYDLKKNNPQMSWSDIAIKIFPEETHKNLAHTKPRKSLKPHPSAVDKVRHYWREANKMINQGGWKQI